MPIRIGIDIDGVLAKTYNIMVPMFNEHYKKSYTPEEVKDWDLSILYGPDAQDHFEKIQMDIYKNVEPYAEARKVLNFLRKKQAEIFYISSRPKEYYGVTREWMNKHQMDYSKIMALGVKDKATMAKNLRLNWFIEDAPHHLKDLPKVVKVIKFEHPYNMEVFGDGIYPANGWSEVLEILKRV